MADTIRVRPVEYQSPRPLILGVCFIWGIAVGFGLNFFRKPEIAAQPNTPNAQQAGGAARAVPSELERRRQDIPSLAEVEPSPVSAPLLKQTIEDMKVDPPAVVLTTEGGLSGKTAEPLGSRSWTIGPAQPGPPPAGTVRPPPIPDLSP